MREGEREGRVLSRKGRLSQAVGFLSDSSVPFLFGVPKYKVNPN